MRSSTPKQFLRISGIPVIAWSMATFQRMREIDGIVVAAPKEHVSEIKKFAKEYHITKLLAIAAGGETRQMSSYHALRAHQFHDTDIVLIHDAARPFITDEIIQRCVAAARKFGACGTYIPVKDTISEVENTTIVRTLPREVLRSAQTPQAFHYSLIRQAHEHAMLKGINNATDDVSLVLFLEKPVHAVEGDYHNIKITTPDDLLLAEHIASLRGNLR